MGLLPEETYIETYVQLQLEDVLEYANKNKKI